jgi:Zn-dependent protease
MFGKSIKLFSIFGFRVSIDLSWLIILVLVVWSLAGGVFPEQYEDLTWQAYLAMGLAAAAGLFASIVIHELCHSLMARQFGVPMKGITLFIFGGLAEMTDEPKSPAAEFLIAVAGPASSLVVAGVMLGVALLGGMTGWPGPVVGVLRWVGIINLILVGFNLIPGFPLDGGRVLRSILWKIKGDFRKATHLASKVGAGFGAVLIGLGILALLTGNPIGGMWWILIGLFVRSAAKQGYQQVIIRQMLEGEQVRRFMNDSPVTAPPDIDVETFVQDYVYQHHFKLFPVVDGNNLAGCVTTRQIKDMPRELWSSTTLGEIAHACSEANTVSPDTDAMDALTRMSKADNSRVMVVDDGRLVGILSLKDLMGFLAMKIELEGEAEDVPTDRLRKASRPPAAAREIAEASKE